MTDNDEAGIKSNRESLISLRGRRGHQEVMRRSSLVSENKKHSQSNEEDFLGLLRSMLNPAIMMDPKFSLLAISNFFGFLGFYIPFVYLPGLAETNGGLESERSAFLLSIIGISNTLGESVGDDLEEDDVCHFRSNMCNRGSRHYWSLLSTINGALAGMVGLVCSDIDVFID